MGGPKKAEARTVGSQDQFHDSLQQAEEGLLDTVEPTIHTGSWKPFS